MTRNWHSFFLLILLLCTCNYALAQENKKKEDSIKVYRAIEKYSKKRKFTVFLHKLFFQPITPKKVKKNSFQKIKKQAYSKMEGKIIRKIKITTLDPFGYSVIDSTQKPTQFFPKAGNFLHFKTRHLTIRNLLLIKKNEPLDSLLVKESERLIRSQRYIRSVVVTSELVSKTSDSVDVSIRVLDSWSMVPDFSISGTKSNFSLKEKNFFGTGHEFFNSYTQGLTSSENGFMTSYTIPNIVNTFIRSTVSYKVELNGNYAKVLDIERPFFSPFARWAAGMYFDQQFQQAAAVDANNVSTTQFSKYNSQDFWGGHSYQIFKGNSEFNRTTNFISTARFFNKSFLQKPITGTDTLGVYTNERLYLVGFGISSRKYTQDKYVFNFNVVEDIASGFTYSITSGFQNKNQQNRLYFGAKVALGSYFRLGYFSTKVEYGTFFNASKTEQSAYDFSFTYFTNLIEIGSWKFRQFVKPQAIIGTKRLNSITDKLTLNGNSGIQGFNSTTLTGTKKLLLTFQTQGYSPWHVVGFRLNPFLSYTMGMLGQPITGFSNSKIYSELGFGVIISNDYLVLNSFQFSFSFFPILPQDGGTTFKSNSIRTYDFGLQDFEISKPLLVNYQ